MRLIADIRVNHRAVPWSTPETIMVPTASGKRRAVHKKDKRLIAWQDTLRAACFEAYKDDEYRGPVRLVIRFRRGTDDRALWGEMWWNRRPGFRHADLTNLLKSSEDSLEPFRVYKAGVHVATIPGVIANDAQVCDIRTRKVYAQHDGCDIKVYALEG